MSERDANNPNNDARSAVYQKLNQDDLIRLEKIFESSEIQKFTINELEDVLNEFNITFTPDQLNSFFLKVKLKILFHGLRIFNEKRIFRSIRRVTSIVIGKNL